MDIEITTWMMIFFIILLVVNMWKIYAFLPNKTLEDDDTTKESHNELIALVLKTIQKSGGEVTLNELFDSITDSAEFDSKHYWRFNHNRLKKLLEQYYLENKDIYTIEDIYNQLKAQ